MTYREFYLEYHRRLLVDGEVMLRGGMFLNPEEESEIMRTQVGSVGSKVVNVHTGERGTIGDLDVDAKEHPATVVVVRVEGPAPYRLCYDTARAFFMDWESPKDE